MHLHLNQRERLSEAVGHGGFLLLEDFGHLMHMGGIFKTYKPPNRCFLLNLEKIRTYHQKVVEEKDLPLVHPCPLRSVGVRNFIKLTAAHQPPMGKGQHLGFCLVGKSTNRNKD